VTPGDLRGAAIIGGLFAVVLVLAELWARRWNGKPEHTRKLVHLGGSAIGVFLPLLVQSVAVAFVLTVGLSVLFLATSKGKLLRSVGGVQRASRGSEYYPLAVFLLFLLAADDYWRYLASLLTLGVADAFAALVGSEYGKLRYSVEEDTKSVEGSLVFLVVAYLAILLPMLLLTDLDRPTMVLGALLAAMVVTGFEAISLRGADNLFVPLAACVILGKITTKPFGEIVFQNVSFITLFLLIGFGARRFPGLNVGATIALLLFTYGLWSLGSPLWAIPVFIAMVTLALARSGKFSGRYVGVRAVTRACLPLVAILVLSNTNNAHNFWYAPYLAAAATLVGIAIVQVIGHRPIAAVSATAACAASILIPAAIAIFSPARSVLLISVVTVLAASAALALRRRYPAESRMGNVIPAMTAIVVATVVAGAEYWRAVPRWIIQ
jgi:phytol kinase